MKRSTIEHAGSAANEHAQEIDERGQFEINKNIAQNPDFAMGDRAQGAVDAVGNKISEKTHEVKKSYHQNQAGLTSDVYTSSPQQTTTVDSTIKHVGCAANEHAQEISQRDQFEMNKNIAQNPDFAMGERAQGAVDAVGNKISEKAHETHEVKKSYHQNQAGLTSDVYTSSPQQKPAISDNIKSAGIAAQEHSKEIDQKCQLETNKNIAQTPDFPMGERTQAAFGVVGNKISEKAHEANKALHQNQAGLSSDVKTSSPQTTTHDGTIKHAGLAAQEHAVEVDQKNQYELNKNLLSNPENPMGERAQAAFEAVGNKISEKAHEVKKAFHQNQAGITSSSDAKITL